MRWIWTYLRTAGSNFHEVVPGQLYRGATPEPKNLKKWHAKYNIRTWIDLRLPSDCDFGSPVPTDRTRLFAAQVRMCQELGIEHIRIPISDREPTDEYDIARCLRLMADSTKHGVFIACEGGRHRAGQMVALYGRRVLGWDEKKVKDSLSQGGFYPNGHERFAKSLEKLLGFALCLLLLVVPAMGQHSFIQPDLQAQASAAAVRRADEIRQQNAASALGNPSDVSDDDRFNWTFALGSLGYWGSVVADIKSTKGSLDRGSIELNPLFGRDRGHKVRYTANAVASAGIYAVAVYAEKKGHRRFARVLLVTGTVIRGAAAVWNHNRRR